VKLSDAIRKVLLRESPELGDASPKSASTTYIDHRYKLNPEYQSGDVIHSTDTHRVTQTHSNGKFEWSRQYIKHNKDSPKSIALRMDFSNHEMIAPTGHKSGTYASMIVKHHTNKQSEYDTLKHVYDKELSHKDYLISDSMQHEGGVSTWKRLTTDYISSGKHVYLKDGNTFTPVHSVDYLNDNHDSIWGYGQQFSSKRIVVSNEKL
jgi:hypothetical protein